MPQGLTVHFIDQYVDKGHIIIREELPVFEDDKIYHIHQRLINEQPKILREALELLARGAPTSSAEKGTLFTQMTKQEEMDLISKCSGLF